MQMIKNSNSIHRTSFNCSEQAANTQWTPRVQKYIDNWVLATEEVIDEVRAHTEATYLRYLRWYLPRTRTRVMFTPVDQQPHVAAVTEAYPRHRDQDYFVMVSHVLFKNYIFLHLC